MLKREHIKQAIDAISKRDPEIGYTLDEMFGMGRITVPENPDEAARGDNLYFYFEDQKATVKKYIYFSEGTVPIEQRLLIKYGEMAKKQELLSRGDVRDYKAAAVEIRKAGLRMMVAKEIDFAIERLKKDLPETFDHSPAAERSEENKDFEYPKCVLEFLTQIKHDTRPLSLTRDEGDPGIWFSATVEKGTPAVFVRFPFCADSLLQIADANFEFFHVRFLLDCLIRGMGANLFACVVDRTIAGLVYLAVKERMFLRRVEIKYMATQRANVDDPLHIAYYTVPPLKGVGTLLVSGAWLYWKTGSIDAREFTLDSEIEARRFYEALGFQSRGLSDFVLKHPAGHLLKTILIMTRDLPNLDRKVIEEIRNLVKREIKTLCKKSKTKNERSRRDAAISAIQACFEPGVHPLFKKTAIEQIIKHKKRISEAEEMINMAAEAVSKTVSEPNGHATG